MTLEWDVLMLAGCHMKAIDAPHPFVRRVITCTTTSGYIVRSHYYRTLLDNFIESVQILESQLAQHIEQCANQSIPVTKLHTCDAIDQHWFVLQRRDTFYICDPVLGRQRDGTYSDINCSPRYQRDMMARLANKQHV
jgi:hypothetical protein